MNDDTRHGITAQEAQAALDQASSTRVTTAKDLRTLARVTVGVGVAMALVLLLIRAAGDNPAVFVIGMGVYGAALAVLMWRSSRIGSAPRGFGKRYAAGIVGTTAAYGIGVALIAGREPAWALVIALAVLVVIPAVLAARSITKLATK
ncbi:hypothetical protein [Mobilicoccus caccae]|uniref:DUF2157 domain-containing protein n=1 Tax=Mobilicoccus caccae TaxID=1859295 RepID=A0ABQ6IXK9_9MICO|nr:hypothetical protein [Mobilicoccus caccae]GMA41429.1 hypothetical protein GCM10025883_34740 [Mobilicoccus caccae]